MNKGRKFTGGKYHAQRKKKLYEKKGQEREVTLGDIRIKKLRIKGGKTKDVLLKTNMVNISVKGKSVLANITNVLETPQNTFLARENRLVKGAIVDTSLGKARITNRPSQEGCVNAILLNNDQKV